MSEDILKTSLVSIAAEMFRLQSVFDKVTSKLELDDQKKYAVFLFLD